MSLRGRSLPEASRGAVATQSAPMLREDCFAKNATKEQGFFKPVFAANFANEREFIKNQFAKICVIRG